jgi:hypothetical protein
MGDGAHSQVTFVPLRPASRQRAIVRAVIGPVVWVVAFVVAAWVAKHSDAIAVGLLVVAVSFLVALLVLSVLRAGRTREERRYAERR